MKKISSILLLILFLVSCSNDDNELQVSDVITGYKITSTTDYDDSSLPDYKMITTGILVDGKLHSESVEAFVNNVSTGPAITQQKYFYTSGLLSQVSLGGNFIDYFYYDNQNQLIGINRNYSGGQTLNYRFIHQSNNTVYCERLNLPYNDPNAEVSQRMILNFDQNDNVISAGYDNDLDGVITNLYNYSYTDNNLTSVQKPDGTIINYDYSGVIDTRNKLRELSYGKRVLRMICSENYCSGNSFSLDYSKNINSNAIISEDYEVLPNNYYNKKTRVESLYDPNAQNIEETEFFFE
ncbi:hypothetical protein [Flavobacterium sp.]|uniref:hypothetical protein n=1 Tax=Flavobacterium sp. TaxID=239 RepID=UPI002B4ABE8A|nr:hypothetical protein [Flavobacterium sp.]HLP64511.1 hypothetical protein [Flavobacterium sp.]